MEGRVLNHLTSRVKLERLTAKKRKCGKTVAWCGTTCHAYATVRETSNLGPKTGNLQKYRGNVLGLLKCYNIT